MYYHDGESHTYGLSQLQDVIVACKPNRIESLEGNNLCNKVDSLDAEALNHDRNNTSEVVAVHRELHSQ